MNSEHYDARVKEGSVVDKDSELVYLKREKVVILS